MGLSTSSPERRGSPYTQTPSHWSAWGDEQPLGMTDETYSYCIAAPALAFARTCQLLGGPSVLDHNLSTASPTELKHHTEPQSLSVVRWASVIGPVGCAAQDCGVSACHIHNRTVDASVSWLDVLLEYFFASDIPQNGCPFSRQQLCLSSSLSQSDLPFARPLILSDS